MLNHGDRVVVLNGEFEGGRLFKNGDVGFVIAQPPGYHGNESRISVAKTRNGGIHDQDFWNFNTTCVKKFSNPVIILKRRNGF